MKYFIYFTVLLTAIIWLSTAQAQQQVITTISGLGACDGEQAQLAIVNSPRGLAQMNDGILIADTINNRIRKLLNNGTIISVAGTGGPAFNGDNILATKASLNTPSSVAVDSNGQIYIADTSNHRIRKVLTNGTITTVAGTGIYGYNGDNILATTAQLYNPTGVVVASNGEVYIADAGNSRIRKILTNGKITTIAGTETAGFNGDNILATTAQLYGPNSIAVAPNGEVYIADTNNHRIRQILTDGRITTIAGTATGGYNGDNILAYTATLYYPKGIKLDPISGEIYIADTFNNRIRKILKNGLITTITGTGTGANGGYNGDNILATNAKVKGACDVLIKDSEIYIADTDNNRIRKILTDGKITTVAGTGSNIFCGEGLLASSVPMYNPYGIAVAPNGEIYIADSGNNRIRKILNNETIITIAGTGSAAYNGDNILATTAHLYRPISVAVNYKGEIYIADYYSSRIRKILTNGTITTVAGTQITGYNGDNILATTAQLYRPYGVAVDPLTGEIYIADSGNHRIRKILNNGIIITVAGTVTAGYNGDNILATTAQLNNPNAIAVNSFGEVYFTDTNNHRIRKILTNGKITTVAGTVTAGYNGDNILATTAKLNYPYVVAVNAINEVLFTDNNNHRIRKILNNGTIITIAGTGTDGYNGENIAATTAQLSYPTGVAVKPNGEILVTTGKYLRLISSPCSGLNNCNGNGVCIGTNNCTCNNGWKGSADCSQPSCDDVNNCNGHGSCSGPNTCLCESGYKGPSCSEYSCGVNNCNGQGTCSGPNTCTCNSGWKGNSDCSQPSCEGVNNCNGEGICTGPNVCTCNSGWKGNVQCSAPSCDGVNNCNGQGTCSGPNTCTCNSGWKGSADCSKPSCEVVNGCNGNGDCIGVNQCQCFSGYKGQSCSEYSCSDVEECNGNGVCTGPNVCTCNSGWQGNGNCSVLSCDALNNCNSNGVCTGSNVCTCFSGWKGNAECTIPSCDGLGNCNGNGNCIDANVCDCISGWQGSENCSLPSCDSVGNCTAHGTCTGSNQCNCESGWKGDVSCSTHTCDGVNNCNGQGTCSGPNTCSCNSGWKGDAVCSTPSCDGVNDCNGQGTCSGSNNCTCNSGWKGNADCSQPSCDGVNNCNSNGVCTGPNTCTCNSGWKGNSDCSQPSCDGVNDCNGEGSCTGPNECTCNSGWKGNAQCSAPSCDGVNNCNTQGTCVGANQCQCIIGFKGPSCSEYSCSDVEECNGNGVCTGPNVCTCNSGWQGNGNCSVLSCDGLNNCNSNGVCTSSNTCTCNSGWKGNAQCSQYSCEAVNNCVGNGNCIGPNTCSGSSTETCQTGWKSNTFGAPKPTITTSYNSDSKKFILNIEMFKNDLPDQNTFNSLTLAGINNLDNSNCQTSDSNNLPFTIVSDGKCSKKYEYQFDTAELGSSNNFVGSISNDGNSLIYSSFITTSYSSNDVNTNICSLYQFTTKVQYQLSLVASQTEFNSIDNIGKFIVKRLYINSDKKFVLEGTLLRVFDKVSSFQDITLTKQNAPALTLSQSSSTSCGSACYNLIFTSDQIASESLDDTYKLQFKMSELPSDSNIPIENTRTLSIDIEIQYTVPVDPAVISGSEITSSITLYNSNNALSRPLISFSTNDKIFLGNAIDDVNIVLPTNTKFSPLNAKICCVPSTTAFPSSGCSGSGHTAFADLVVNKVVQQNVDVAIEGQDLNSKTANSKEYYLQFLIKDKLSNIPTSAQTCRIYIESTIKTLNSRNVERNELFSTIVKSQSQFNIVDDTTTEREEMTISTLITNNYYSIIVSSVIVGSGLLLSLVIAILVIVYVYFQKKKKNSVNNVIDQTVSV